VGDVPGRPPAARPTICPGRGARPAPSIRDTKGLKRRCDSLEKLMRLWLRAVLALLLLTVGSACGTARPGPQAGLGAPAPSRHVLSNGIPVIVQEHRASDVVAVQLWVRAGARDETDSEQGLAHFLEHMLFKGTPSRQPGFIEREVEGVGGRVNAGTSWDYTFYHTVLPASRAVAGIEMLADIVVNASLDAGLLEQEKHVVLEEMRRGEDTARGFLMKRLYSLAFEGHPYGRPVIGTPEIIRGLTRDTLAAFYRRQYVPEAFALIVVGAVDRDEVVHAAQANLGRLPLTSQARLAGAPPPAPRSRRVDVVRPGAYANLAMAWLAPRLDHADTPALDLLVTVLGGSRSSRLVEALRERLGIVSAISADLSALEQAGLIAVTARLEPAELARVESEILREIGRIREAGVTEDERRRAVTAAEADHEFSTETAEGRARALGRAETTWRLEGELGYLDRLRSVTGAQIQTVARRYLDPERYTRLALVPAAATR
jgi:zinc protease